MQHASVALLLACAAFADPPHAAAARDYPSDPEEMDKLCEDVGAAPNISVPAKDRTWF